MIHGLIIYMLKKLFGKTMLEEILFFLFVLLSLIALIIYILHIFSFFRGSNISQTLEFSEGPSVFNPILGAASCCLWRSSHRRVLWKQTSDTSYCPNELMEARRGLREHGNATQRLRRGQKRKTKKKSRISVYVCWEFQVCTSRLCELHAGPGLASKLVVMSQNPALVSTC